MSHSEEIFPIVNESGQVTGQATRTLCHSGSMLLHPVVHLHILNAQGQLFLQKRSENKDIQPGKWDTGVGGHVDLGEEILTALRRETREELGVEEFEPVWMLQYVFQSDIERELVHCFATRYDGPIYPDPKEVSEGRFWSFDEIDQHLEQELFTPNFCQEYLRIRETLRRMASHSL